MASLFERAQLDWLMPKCLYYPCSIPPVANDSDAPGYAEGYLYAVTMAMREDFYISEDDILTLHKKVCQGFPESLPGEYRNIEVAVKGDDFQFPKANQVSAFIHALIKDEENIFRLSPPQAAAAFHQKLVDIHPFINANGRVARLCMEAILLHYGYWPLLISHSWKDEYSEALKIGRTVEGKEAFISLIERKVIENENLHKEGSVDS